MIDWQTATTSAQRLADTLAASRRRIVLAESCTCGMGAALLGQSPGISNWFCGSLVVYRPQSKQQWLQVPADLLAAFTAESAQVSSALAEQALSRTSEADFSIAVTGHLGPDAPVDKDGKIFLAAVGRSQHSHQQLKTLQSSTRAERQLEAAIAMLDFAVEFLAGDTNSES